MWCALLHATVMTNQTTARTHCPISGKLPAILIVTIFCCLCVFSLYMSEISQLRKSNIVSQPILTSPIAHFPLLSRSDNHAIFANPTVLLHKQTEFPGSLGEYMRVVTPFIMHRSIIKERKQILAAMPAAHNLSCFDFSSVPIEISVCRKYLGMQTNHFRHSPLSYHDSLFASALKTIPKRPRCLQSDAVIVDLNFRDINVCHTMMRFLLAWHIMLVSRSVPLLPLQGPINQLIVIARDRFVYDRYKPSLLDASPAPNFHVGLLQKLFEQNGVRVLVVRSFDKLIPSSGNTVCLRSATIMGSYANRFAFPDSLLRTDKLNTTYPLPHPLSTDALLLRKHIFTPHRPPKMRRKLLYVTRKIGGRRSFTKDGEKTFQNLLRNIADHYGVHFVIFRGSPSMSFENQIQFFTDASVIVGMHGAGLSLSTMAPRGATLIEIEPEDHGMILFKNVLSSGLGYHHVKLSKGTRVKGSYSSLLIKKDQKILEGVVKLALNESLQLVGSG